MPLKHKISKNNNGSLRNYNLPDKYGAWLGYDVIKYKKGQAWLGLKLREDHLSPSGRIHGGVVSGFFDFACGAAVFTTMGAQDYCSTVELKVNYFQPLDPGSSLVCHSKVIFRGKRLCVIHALLYRDGDKRPVAMATATFNIVSKKSE
jgi:acyl-CoA thioesterase